MDETRFWVALVATVASGFNAWCGTSESSKETPKPALRQMGWAILAMQVGCQLYMIFSPSFTYSIHRSLPLHMCGINIWLIALNYSGRTGGSTLHDVHGHGAAFMPS